MDKIYINTTGHGEGCLCKETMCKSNIIVDGNKIVKNRYGSHNVEIENIDVVDFEDEVIITITKKK